MRRDLPARATFPASLPRPVPLRPAHTPSPLRRALTGVSVAALMACKADAKDPVVPPDGPAGEVSASASSLTISSDTVAVGRAVVISVVPRDAQGRKYGPNLTVALDASGGSSAGQLGTVTWFAYDSSYRARYTGSTAGTALVVRATVTGVALTTTRPLRVRPAPAQVFTRCSAVGEVCEFIGRRDVRLVASGGATYTQAFYGGVPCAPSGYARGFTGTPAGDWVRCDIGELQLTDVANALQGMSGLDAPALQLPRGDDGEAAQLVRTAAIPPVPNGEEGSFRMTCQLAKMDFFDPIVYPGQPNSSHLHMFFGSSDITPSSTPASLAAGGRGNCLGGTVNRTGYWVPAVFDVRTNEVIAPDFATIYYKTGYNVAPASVREIPAGLVMIAGNRENVGGVQVVNNLEVASWGCEKAASTNTGAMPSCPAGDRVTLKINFPQCWNGRDLDSPDHKSHMAYPDYRNPPQVSTCPASHPVMLPIITEIFHWPVAAGADPSKWRLTSDMYALSTRGGYSAHADWMNGWNPVFFRAIVTNCLQAGRDCLVGLLGDGRELY